MAGVRLPFLLCGLACALWACAATPLAAQSNSASTPALPAWPDHQSVYYKPIRFGVVDPDEPTSKPDTTPTADKSPSDFTPPPLEVASRPTIQPVSSEMPRSTTQPREPQAFVAPASGTEPAESPPPARDPRRLAPPRDGHATRLGSGDRAAGSRSLLPEMSLPLDSIYTTGTALAVVVGLFLMCAWLVRRGVRKSAAQLPEGVVSVLGRVPLAARQFAELVRVGNKLVLLSVSTAGVETLTEITDSEEIDRLMGLCQQGNARSSTSEFDAVFRQLAAESAPDDFLGHEASLRGGMARA